MRARQPADPLSRHEFLKWYHVAAPGQALQALESAYLEANIQVTYTQRAVQIGRLGSESRYIDPEFAGHFILGDEHGPRSFPTFVQARADALPFASESIDVLVLPHVLEFVEDRHQVLREVERVLKPEGRLLVLGLNPWHPGRLLRLTRGRSFWSRRFIGAHQLLDWLSLLKFDAQVSSLPAARGARTSDASAPAWAELGAGLSLAYAIRAIKRSYTLIPIDSEWSRLAQLVAKPLIDPAQVPQG